MKLAKKTFHTVEEYLSMEEYAEYKSEYYYGEIFAMAGSTPNHNQIEVNLITALNTALRKSPCRVFTGNMKVRLAEKTHYAYPDVSVVCGKPEFAENRKDIIANPIVIVEILSESTRDYDRGAKFEAYRNIGTLRDYILVEQERCLIEYFHKSEAGRWISEEYEDMEETLLIRSLNLEISLETVYARVEWGSGKVRSI